MSGIRRRFGALGGFTGITLALLVTSLISVPTLIATLGSATWADLSVVQSVAGVASVLVVFGWGVTGPAAIAAMSDSERFAAFQDSVVIRLALFVVAAPVALVIAAVSTHLTPLVSVLGVVSNLMPALGAGWFFVGVASARMTFLLDALPRIAASLLGIVVALLSHSVVAYLAVQLAGGIVLVVGSYVGIRARHGHARRLSLRSLRGTAREQSAGVMTAIMGAAYTNVPVVFVGAVGGVGRDEILFAFRILRIAITAVTPLTQFFQGWVPRRDTTGAQYRRRMSLSLRVIAVVAVVITAGIAALLPLVSEVVSTGQILVPPTISLPIGIAVGAIAVSQTTGLVCLVALGRVRAVAVSTTLGAVAGVVLMLLLDALGGVPGVAWSVAAAEVVVLAYQCVALRRSLRAPVTTPMQAPGHGAAAVPRVDRVSPQPVSTAG